MRRKSSNGFWSDRWYHPINTGRMQDFFRDEEKKREEKCAVWCGHENLMILHGHMKNCEIWKKSAFLKNLVLHAKYVFFKNLLLCRVSVLLVDTFLVRWTSIYQLFWGSLGTRVLTHPQITTFAHSHVSPSSIFVIVSVFPSLSLNRHRWKKKVWVPYWDIWRFPSMGIPENGWFLKVYTVMENPIKMDVLGIHPFPETSININKHIPNRQKTQRNVVCSCKKCALQEV